jgi:hypothetical protein
VSYVDAGYAVALSTLLVYAVSLLVRRRRWERAFEMSRPPESSELSELSQPSERSEPSEPSDRLAPGHPDVVPASGERS